MFEITKDIFKHDIRIDLTSNKKEIKIISKINPEFVFHLAAAFGFSIMKIHLKHLILMQLEQ